MKKTLKSIISIMVTAALLMSAAACFTTAAAKNTFTLKVKSNFFPEKTVCYSDLDKLEDESLDLLGLSNIFEMFDSGESFFVNSLLL